MRRCHLQSRPTAPMSSVDKLTSAKRPNMSEPCCSLKARTQLEEKLELNLMGILARFDESQDAFNVAWTNKNTLDKEKITRKNQLAEQNITITGCLTKNICQIAYNNKTKMSKYTKEGPNNQ